MRAVAHTSLGALLLLLANCTPAATGPTDPTEAPRPEAATEAEPPLPHDFAVHVPAPPAFSVEGNDCYGGAYLPGRRYEFWCAGGLQFMLDQLPGATAADAQARVVDAVGPEGAPRRGTVTSEDGLTVLAAAFDVRGIDQGPNTVGGVRSLAIIYETGGDAHSLQCLGRAERFDAKRCASALLAMRSSGLDPAAFDRFAPDQVEGLGQTIDTEGICKRPRPDALQCFGVEISWDPFRSREAALAVQQAMQDDTIGRFEGIGGELLVPPAEHTCTLLGTPAECRALRMRYPGPKGEVEMEVHYAVGEGPDDWVVAICSFDLAQVSDAEGLPDPCAAVIQAERLP